MLCASGVLGPPGESGVDEVLSYGAGLPADGIEFLVRNSHRGRLDQLLPLLGTSGLNFPVVHLAKGVAARLPAQEARIELTENLRFAAALGAKLGVLHLWDLPHSDRNFNGRLAAYGLASELASEHGIEVGIESIPCTVASPLRNLRRILDRHPDAALVYDTEFLASHGELDAALDEAELWPAVRHIHIKDFNGGFTEPDGRRRWRGPGEGTIDFRRVSAAIRRHGFVGTVSLEAGPHQQVDGPDRSDLDRVLRILGTDDWDFRRPADPNPTA